MVKGETGTITLNFVYTDVSVTPNTTTTISKIISWDAKLDASSAAYLTFEYDGATYFKNENGTTKVTPKLIQNSTNILDSTYTVTWKD